MKWYVVVEVGMFLLAAPAQMQDGFVIYNPVFTPTVSLIDTAGRLVRSWNCSTPRGARRCPSHPAGTTSRGSRRASTSCERRQASVGSSSPGSVALTPARARGRLRR